MRTEVLLLVKKPEAPSKEVLDSYTRARALFNSGSVAAAKQMVDQLWTNPQAKNWGPLIQLKNQIDRNL
jgi:hypothetical protein